MMELEALTHEVIGAAYKVANTLGTGFVEKVYENALALELRKRGVAFSPQHALKVRYDGVVVGEFVADLLVEGVLIVELKAVKALDDAHFGQCLNYLKAAGLRHGLLINFGGERVELRRVVNGF